MRNTILSTIALLACLPAAAAEPTAAFDITNAQIQEVLKKSTGATLDQALRTIDMGGYQLSVAILKRGPLKLAANPATPRPRAAGAVPCGPEAAPAGAKPGPGGMLSHDDTAETYIILSGSGTLVTGGTIVSGSRLPLEGDVTKIMVGPTCSGMVAGDVVTRKLVAGDVSVIPAGVPHGWTEIEGGVTYLSIRPDPKKILQPYTYPGIKP